MAKKVSLFAKSAPVLLLAVTDYAAAGATGPTVTWAPVGSTPVPTLGTWALMMLIALFALVAFRAWREAPNALRSVLLLAMAGSAGGVALWTSDVESSAMIVPTASCEGSYTVETDSQPVELENNCGAPVVLSIGSCSDGDILTCWVNNTACAQSGDQLANGQRLTLPYCALDF